MTTSKDITPVNLTELENAASKIINDVREKNKPTHFAIACRLETDIQELQNVLSRGYGRNSIYCTADNAYHTTEAMFLIGLSSVGESIYNREELSKINVALKYLCDLHCESSTFMEA